MSSRKSYPYCILNNLKFLQTLCVLHQILSHNSVYICGWNGFATLSNFLSSPPALVSPLLKANFVQFNNTASIFPLHADPGIWYVPPDAHLSSRYGLGGRKCNDAAPEFAIRTRCRCKHSACRKEAEILDDILAKVRLLSWRRGFKEHYCSI